MKRNFILGILILYVLSFSNNSTAQNKIEINTLKNLKELSDFNNWPGKAGQIIEGIDLSSYLIPGLTTDILVKQKMPFFYQETGEGELLIKHRSKWIASKNDFIEITITISENCTGAHEYLINRYYHSQLPFAARIKLKDQPTVAGDISFDKGRKFIRNNIVVEIHAEGYFDKMIGTIAKEVDNLLVAKPSYISSDELKPMINRFEIENTLVDFQSSTRLNIDVYDPLGRKLSLFWKVTGGSVDKDRMGNYYYYATAEKNSTQKITLIAMNNIGFYKSESILISIK